jgi:ketosteroid isomerase-like protein
MTFPKENTIYIRNKEATIEAENLFWRAMCDSGGAVKKYLADDSVLVFPDGNLLTKDSEPSINDTLNSFEPWSNFKIRDDPEFVEIDMMATSLVYKISLARHNSSGFETSEAIGTSVWRQDAGGDWRVCVHHVTIL